MSEIIGETNGSAARVGRLTLRVYYEDTDFSGLVYHASYLRFLERGRTEWLREMGLAQGELAQAQRTTFVVRRIAIDYLKPANMDDQLVVETRVSRLGGASVEFEQIVVRGAQRLVQAFVDVVYLRDGKPARMPVSLREQILGASNTAA